MEQGRTVIVTGGAGFVGSNLVRKLHAQGDKVYCIDNLAFGSRLNYIEGVTYLEVHTKSINTLDIPTPDIIFHLGEYSKIAPSFDEIGKVFDLNILGSFEILEYARSKNIPIVYAASSTRLADEGDNHSPYSYFKSSIVQLLKNYSTWYNLRYSICYFYNVYGEGQDTCNNGWETVVSIFEKQYKAGKLLTVTGDGQQRRDFTYVGDIVDGLLKASENFHNEEYQLGSGQDFSILEVAQMFGGDVEFIPARKGDRLYSKADTITTHRKLGWKPSYTLPQWINRVKQDTPDIVVMTTAVDRPELHLEVFKQYKEYLRGVNLKWVITINSLQGIEKETEENFKELLRDYDVHIKTFHTGGTRQDWYNSVKYCMNYALQCRPKVGYFWLEDDWGVTEGSLQEDLKALQHPKDYLCLVNRKEVSFNPGVWGTQYFEEVPHFAINNPDQSLGKRYVDGLNTNAERICCPFPEATHQVHSLIRKDRFVDVGRQWQENTIKVRTFSLNKE